MALSVLSFNIIVFIFFSYFFCGYAEYEGDTCKNNDGQVGTCKLETDCPVAEKEIIETETHSFHRCGFKKDVEIVCCPTTTDLRSSDVPRKSVQACENYKNKKPFVLGYQIANGEDVEDGNYPHMASLGMYRNETEEYVFRCGATLISDRHLVTAAHCLYPPDGAIPMIVRMGTVVVPESTTYPNVTLDYTIKNYTNHSIDDIAIVVLEKPVRLTGKVWPACLHTDEENFEEFLILGWGKTTKAERSEILQRATVKFAPHQTCAERYFKVYNWTLAENVLCAIGKATDICVGDSGGPLQTATAPFPILIGVAVGGGPKCGDTNVPSTYTMINKHLDWIEERVWPGKVTF